MAVCSGCHQPAPGYDHLPERCIEFIPLWGFLVFLVFLLYRMRRVECRNCGVVVEEVPGVMVSTDQSLHVVSGPLSEEAVLEGNRRGLPHFLGPGVRCR
jgi:transposase